MQHGQRQAPASIDGVVEKVRHHNPDTGWTIIMAMVGSKKVGLVGEMSGQPEKGAKFTATGSWADDPKWGRQFRFDAIEIHAPTTLDGIIARLTTYPKIGDAMARRIVSQFGDGTWNQLDANIDVLRNVPGIGAKAFAEIKAHHQKRHGPIEQIKARLHDVGAPESLAKKIHDAYGDRSIAMLNDHPYRVAAKIERFGFTLAERFAKSTGIDPEHHERVEAGVIHALRQTRLDGNSCAPSADLADMAARILNVRVERVDEAIDRMLDHGPVKYDHGMLFLGHVQRLETKVAQALLELTRPVRVVWMSQDLPEHLSPGQREAVLAVARSGVTVLTGGPGTGKSTAVGAVIKMAERAGVDVILCAPTGRAAKRLSEATGRAASTIHRLLRPVQGTGDFHHCELRPLPPGLVVVDEVSMVDLDLASSLLAALTTDHRLLLVGDADQLPSVGSGNVLQDVVDAAEDGARISLVRLRQVFRQSEGSPIIANAHRMLAGEPLRSDDPAKGADGQFYMIRAESPADAQSKISALAAVRVPLAYNLDPKTEVQVLSPVHAGPTGTDAFNAALQRRYKVDGQPCFFGAGIRYFIGDRVMQTRNDYEHNVFNGDIGTVIGFDDASVSVDFDGAVKKYNRFDLRNLTLAYAMTIHKSQGGEFPAVIVPVMRTGRPMTRNLLYTAITRARSLCILVGHIDAMQQAVTTSAERRWTRLSQRLTTQT